MGTRRFLGLLSLSALVGAGDGLGVGEPAGDAMGDGTAAGAGAGVGAPPSSSSSSAGGTGLVTSLYSQYPKPPVTTAPAIAPTTSGFFVPIRMPTPTPTGSAY